ncbi:hypothetical protein DFH06DRAFT_224 [Mycena polygramma]|nr:hypothetical protein DFH06DRAFT_224 [Mycena polygramma]
MSRSIYALHLPCYRRSSSLLALSASSASVATSVDAARVYFPSTAPLPRRRNARSQCEEPRHDDAHRRRAPPPPSSVFPHIRPGALLFRCMFPCAAKCALPIIRLTVVEAAAFIVPPPADLRSPPPPDIRVHVCLRILPASAYTPSPSTLPVRSALCTSILPSPSLRRLNARPRDLLRRGGVHRPPVLLLLHLCPPLSSSGGQQPAAL